MDNDDTIVLTPEEKDKILKDNIEESSEGDENEED